MDDGPPPKHVFVNLTPQVLELAQLVKGTATSEPGWQQSSPKSQLMLLVLGLCVLQAFGFAMFWGR